MLWKSGSLWPVCCGRAKLGYSGTTLGSVLWKSYFGPLNHHFGQCAVEELLWATQGSLWPVCCGRATLGYSGITLASVLWKGYFGPLRDHFGQCAVEEPLWATQGSLCQGSLWPVCCGRATLGWITLASVLWKGYFGLLRDHFGQCAVEELSWATGRTEVQSSKNLTTPQSCGWELKGPLTLVESIRFLLAILVEGPNFVPRTCLILSNEAVRSNLKILSPVVSLCPTLMPCQPSQHPHPRPARNRHKSTSTHVYAEELTSFLLERSIDWGFLQKEIGMAQQLKLVWPMLWKVSEKLHPTLV